MKKKIAVATAITLIAVAIIGGIIYFKEIKKHLVIKHIKSIQKKISIIESIVYKDVVVDDDDVTIISSVIKLKDNKAVINIDKTTFSHVSDVPTVTFENVSVSSPRYPDVVIKAESLEFSKIKIDEFLDFVDSGMVNHPVWYVSQFTIKQAVFTNIYIADRSNKITMEQLIATGDVVKGNAPVKLTSEIKNLSLSNSLISLLTGADKVTLNSKYNRVYHNNELKEVYNVAVDNIFNFQFSHTLGDITLDKDFKTENILNTAKIKDAKLIYDDINFLDLLFNTLEPIIGNRETVIAKYITDDYLSGLQNRDTVISEITEFMKKTDKLAISINPSIPVSFNEINHATPDIFNQLNFKIKINDNPELTLHK